MESAFKWFLKATRRGHLNAQINVAAMYDEGKGVEKDEAKAFEWMLKTAEQGDAQAIFSVAARYKKGKGVQQDEAKALQWFERYDQIMADEYNE